MLRRLAHLIWGAEVDRALRPVLVVTLMGSIAGSNAWTFMHPRPGKPSLEFLAKKKMHRGGGSLVRLSQLTSGEPAATREAFNLRRSYLGAITTLEARIGSVK